METLSRVLWQLRAQALNSAVSVRFASFLRLLFASLTQLVLNRVDHGGIDRPLLGLDRPDTTLATRTCICGTKTEDLWYFGILRTSRVREY